eukprot:15438566-Alexandrium_andersonii.AAC.1
MGPPRSLFSTFPPCPESPGRWRRSQLPTARGRLCAPLIGMSPDHDCGRHSKHQTNYRLSPLMIRGQKCAPKGARAQEAPGPL